jgi:hypothetical protein
MIAGAATRAAVVRGMLRRFRMRSVMGSLHLHTFT